VSIGKFCALTGLLIAKNNKRRSVLKVISRLFRSFGVKARVSPSGPDRRVILHHHLFKNAGTTVDWILRRNFGANFCDHRDDRDMKKGAEYLGGFIARNSGVRAISSHHMTLPLPELSGVKCLNLVMFRHPIERVTSVYSFERKQVRAHTPGAIKARELDLRDYVLWRMTPSAGATIRNFQVRRMLPPREKGVEAISEIEMEAAIKFAGSLEMLGMVDRFDESMVLFEHYLANHFKDIDFAYVIQNVGQSPVFDRTRRIDSLRVEIGDDAFDLLVESNKRDLELYSWVEKEFERRIMAIEDFEVKLEKFRLRCGMEGSRNHPNLYLRQRT
jgi:hypothetical protein